MRKAVFGGALALAAIFATASASAADKVDAEAALAAFIDPDVTFAERTKALSAAGVKARHIEKDKSLQRLLRAGLALEQSIRPHPGSFKGAEPDDFEVDFVSIFLSDRIDTVIRTRVTRTEPLP